MDFFKILQKTPKKGVVHIFPDFRVLRSKDLMVRGKSFYAVWDEERGFWSTDEFDVQRLVDKELYEYSKFAAQRLPDDIEIDVKYMGDFSSNSWAQFRKYLSLLTDNAHQLDEHLTFANTDYKRTDYVSKKLSYPLEPGTTEAWDTFMSTAYDPEEREKIEWAIGAIVAGDAKNIQKFLVIYGEAGSGKSTVLNIIQKLFDGYYTTFESRALGSSTNTFATEAFRGNPLVAIEHDGDLSRLDDNTRLNSLVSHEEMTMNEKYKATYTARSNAFVIMGTNKPVRITDGKSGLLRRLIDVNTSGRTLPIHQYQTVISRIDFELGAIAHHCLEVYRKLGRDRYLSYKPTRMQFETDIFFNFVEEKFYTFRDQDGTTLSQAWDMYKQFCEETSVEFRLPRHKFRAELKNYFRDFRDVGRNKEGKQMRSIFSGFIVDKFKIYSTPVEEVPMSLVLDSTESLLDKDLAAWPAQYANESGTPMKRWAEVNTTLSDLDTTKLHYVVMPDNHIVVDFDLKDKNGEKSPELNIEAASQWPPTYAEFSKSGKGIHLHYDYDGDPTKLCGVYAEGIEIKRTITGDNGPTSLRRKLSKCNNLPVAHISSGLPLKGEKVIDVKAVTSEKGLRDLIIRNLNKEIHPGTKPSIDFIYKILEDAYKSGLKYDVSQLFPAVLAFANNSSHQSDYCVKLVSKMKFQSDHEEGEDPIPAANDSDPIVFFDVEVFLNLFVVCWKYEGPDQKVVRMINPTPSDIGELLKMKLVGFNNRRYDNHILYGRYIGYDNERLFEISSKIVSTDNQNGYFRQAYDLSYTDIYDFASAGNKKSLKKWEIELGIHHQELGHPWDQPVPEDLWIKVAEYCENDVLATEVVFNHLSGDWAARKVLAELSGLTVNNTTNQHTTKIVFGDLKADTKNDLVYTDLSEMFPGYTFDAGKSTYRGEVVGEGGYVYSEPGMYEDVALLDIASMHPASIVALNLLGKYTQRFDDLRLGRIAIKHNDREKLKTLLDGKLIPFVERADRGEFKLADLSLGLKTGLNSGYGLTYAHHNNPFKDPRNIDNIVAKRGALFMVDLKYALQEHGYKVVHIKTDSVKIANATKEAIQFVFDFGKKYGYDFEHEATYSRFCLVNDAVYIAKLKDGKKAGSWTATGAEFAHPFVFKTLFSHEPIEFSDMCEDKSVTGKSALYLDLNENLEEGEHNYQFVGRVGLFCPVEPGTGGGLLMREKDGKYYAATGSKGYRWLEAEVVKDLGLSDQIDTSYHETLVADAIEHISKFGDFDKFVSE